MLTKFTPGNKWRELTITAPSLSTESWLTTQSWCPIYTSCNFLFFQGLFIIQLLGFVFMPVYLASGVYTTPEYVRRRFGGRRCNVYLAVQNLIMFVFTKLSVSSICVDTHLYVPGYMFKRTPQSSSPQTFTRETVLIRMICFKALSNWLNPPLYKFVKTFYNSSLELS